MSTGFEFKKAGSTSHPMASKAVQSLRIEHTSDAAETWTITVLNPGTGQFKLTMRSPNQNSDWVSGAIKCNVDTDTMWLAIRNFFTSGSRAGSDIRVFLKMYDAAD